MVRAKILSKKTAKKINAVNKKSSNRLKKIFAKLAGKELAIGISIGFFLMSLLMLFANNLNVKNSQLEEQDSYQIHAAAGEFDTVPGIE